MKTNKIQVFIVYLNQTFFNSNNNAHPFSIFFAPLEASLPLKHHLNHDYHPFIHPIFLLLKEKSLKLPMFHQKRTKI